MSTPLTLTIAGVVKDYLAQSLTISFPLNNPSSAQFDIASVDGSYYSAEDAAVVISRGATVIFGGYVDKPSTSGFMNEGLTPIVTRVSASGYQMIPNRRYVNANRPVSTLKETLQDFVSYLTAYGVTLDGAQATGPTFQPPMFYYVLMLTVLNTLATMSGYVWEIDENKVLRMYAPGSVSAPFNIADGDGHVIGDVTVARSQTGTTTYANRVIGLFSQAAVAADAFLYTVNTGFSDSNTVTIGSQVYKFRETKSITSLTRSGGTATAVTSAAHNFSSGDTPIIAGAVQTAYNGQFVITVIDAVTFTYPVAGTPATPATGTITIEALTGTAGEVFVGPTREDCITNLTNAINHGFGAGTLYTAATPLDPNVSAQNDLYFAHTTHDIMHVAAKVAGAAGNTLGVSTTSINAQWIDHMPQNTLTLVGGADAALTNVAFANDLTEQGLHGIWEIVIQAPSITELVTAQALVDAYLLQSTPRPKTVTYVTDTDGLKPGQTQTIHITNRNVNNTFMITDVEMFEVDTHTEYRITAIEGSVYQNSWMSTYQQWSGGGSSLVAAGGGGGIVPVGGVPSVTYFGGSAIEYVRSTGPTWVPADSSNAGADPGLQITIDTVARGSTTGIFTVRLRARSGTVQARLRDVSNGATVGTSTVVSSTTFQRVTFAVTLTAGSNVYQLELLPSLANVDVAGVGYFQ